MDFIIDNLVWFIAGGVVILMTIIGYFAEKTDFGKKSSSTNNEDEEATELKKEKHTKKEKPTKKEKEPINEENIQNQPVEEQNSSELPIPIAIQAPVILEQQNVEPIAVEPMEKTAVENIPTEVKENPIILEQQNVEPVAVEPIENTATKNIPTEINSEPNIQEVIPVDLQTAAIEDGNMKIQPALEAEPIPQIYHDQVAEIPTMENMVLDELPVIPEEVENSIPIVQPVNVIEEPTIMSMPLADGINLKDNANQASTIDEKPVVITDEKVVPIDELTANMDEPPITVEQGIPAVNMELPNLDTIAQDNTQSDEEDIWKF